MTETYVDPWQDYKAINLKLKKRFLRKPNLSQAAQEFNALATRLKEEDCLPYTGACYTAIANVQRQAGNTVAEIQALQDAARAFAQAEKDKHFLGLPGFSENLTSAIQCYGQAIKCLSDKNYICLAGSLCVELGLKLFNLDRPQESIEHFERGVRFLDTEPISKQLALGYLAMAQAESAYWSLALASIDELWTFVLKLYGETKSGAAGQKLGKCEMASLLLLIIMRAQPKEMNGRQNQLMKMYSMDDESAVLQVPRETYLNEGQFLLLQSFMQSVKWNQSRNADSVLAEILAQSEDPLIALLGLHIVEQLYCGNLLHPQ